MKEDCNSYMCHYRQQFGAAITWLVMGQDNDIKETSGRQEITNIGEKSVGYLKIMTTQQHAVH